MLLKYMPTTCKCLLTSMGKKEDQNSPVDEREAGGGGWGGAREKGGLTEGGKTRSKRWKETEYNTQREA